MPRDRRLRSPDPAGTALGCQLSALLAVDERMEPRQSTDWRRLEWLAIVLTRSGEAAWDCGGFVLEHRPGTLILLAPGIRHRQIVGADWWHTGYLLLQGPWTSALAAAIGPSGALALRADGRLRAEVDRALVAVLEASPGWDWQAVAGLAEVFGRVQAAARSDDPDLPLAERLARLVDGDPSNGWSVPALAARLGCSVSSLAHRCTAETGLPPAAWLRRRRVGHAQRLLAAGLPVAVVSERLGFANPYHFARVVRQELGVPPSRIAAAPPPGPLSG